MRPFESLVEAVKNLGVQVLAFSAYDDRVSIQVTNKLDADITLEFFRHSQFKAFAKQDPSEDKYSVTVMLGYVKA